MSTLTGTGTIGQFFFFQGNFVEGSSTNGGYIGAVPISAGDCSTSGQLGFGSSSDKCVIRSGFSIQSDPENSQLGASLSFGSGGFFACGTGLDVRGKFYQLCLSYDLILFYFPGLVLPGYT